MLHPDAPPSSLSGVTVPHGLEEFRLSVQRRQHELLATVYKSDVSCKNPNFLMTFEKLENMATQTCFATRQHAVGAGLMPHPWAGPML